MTTPNTTDRMEEAKRFADAYEERMGCIWQPSASRRREELIACAVEALSASEAKGRQDGVREGIKRAAEHLQAVSEAMWERCETRRPENPMEVGEGEKDDATTAWCFEQAAKSILSNIDEAK